MQNILTRALEFFSTYGRRLAVPIAVLSASFGTMAHPVRSIAADPAPTKPPPAATPAKAMDDVAAENPLRAADAITRQRAVAEAWTTFQRSCRPCHGNLGAGDGPYAMSAARPGADLRRPNRDIAKDAVRFTRIRDGAAALPERAWESNMPAFGDDLDALQIWGLVALLEDFGKEASGIDPSAIGADVYASRCAVCHGINGNGEGPLASEFLPLPRNLLKGNYRFRSTEFGEPPLDTDLIGATARGLEGTAMGPFLPLGAIRLEDVAAHVQTLAPEVFATKPDALTGSPIPAEPAAQLAARGRTVYDEARCWECHGKEGRGNGPSAATLKDDTGRPSIATNLTKRWHLKAGGGAPVVFRILTGGMNGTPMASYASTLSAEDRWAVAHYVERLSKPRPRFSPTIQAEISNEQLPLDPTAALWKTIRATPVLLGPQVEIPPYWTQPSVDAIDVTVAVNRDQLGVLLVWDDRTRDVRNDDAGSTSTIAATLARHGAWRLSDQVALQFAEKVDPKIGLPPPYLGDTDRPVLRWIWSADRQERGEPAISERAAGSRSTPAPLTGDTPVQTAATYMDGQWRVVVLGKRPPKTVVSTAIALQSWDGSAGEAGHWHSLSGWISVNLR